MPRRALLPLLVSSALFGCAADMGSDDPGGAGGKADGLGDYGDGVSVSYLDQVYTVCSSFLMHERFDVRCFNEPFGQDELPAHLKVTSSLEQSLVHHRMEITTPDVRILAEPDLAVTLGSSASEFTDATFGFELSYHLEPDDPWVVLEPPAGGHWVTAEIHPETGLVSGTSSLCSGASCKTSDAGAAIDDVFDAKGPAEYRIGLIPITVPGGFKNDWNYTGFITMNALN